MQVFKLYPLHFNYCIVVGKWALNYMQTPSRSVEIEKMKNLIKIVLSTENKERVYKVTCDFIGKRPHRTNRKS